MDQEVHPSMTLMGPLPFTTANLEQGTEKYEESNIESQFGHVPQTEGFSPSHG